MEQLTVVGSASVPRIEVGRTDANDLLAAAVAKIDGNPTLISALAEQGKAEDEVVRLKAARTRLNASSKDLFTRLGDTAARATDALIDDSLDKEILAAVRARSAAVSELEATTGAIQELLIRRLPIAEILGMRAQSDAMYARGRLLVQAADDAASAAANAMQAVSAIQGVAVLDVGSGLTGALNAMGGDLITRAHAMKADADEADRKLSERLAAHASMGIVTRKQGN